MCGRVAFLFRGQTNPTVLSGADEGRLVLRSEQRRPPLIAHEPFPIRSSLQLGSGRFQKMVSAAVSGSRGRLSDLRYEYLTCSIDFLRALFAVVRNRFAIAVAFLAFFQLVGGPWAILQTGAWMGMIAAYSKDGDFSTAISKTFDGKHPCPLCCAVQDGRKQEEKKAPALQLELKKDLIIGSFVFEVARDFVWRDYLQPFRNLLGITLEPLIPPPRIG